MSRETVFHSFVVFAALLIVSALSQGVPVQFQGQPEGQPQALPQAPPQVQLQVQPQGQPNGQPQGQPQGQAQDKAYTNPYFDLDDQHEIFHGPFIQGPLKQPPQGVKRVSKTLPKRKNPYLEIPSFESVKGIAKHKYFQSDYSGGPFRQARIKRIYPKMVKGPLVQVPKGVQIAPGPPNVQAVPALQGLPNPFANMPQVAPVPQAGPQGSRDAQGVHYALAPELQAVPALQVAPLPQVIPPLQGLPGLFANMPQVAPVPQVALVPQGSRDAQGIHYALAPELQAVPALRGLPNLFANMPQVAPVPQGSRNAQGVPYVLAPELQAKPNPPGYKYFDLNELNDDSILDSSNADSLLPPGRSVPGDYPVFEYEEHISLHHYAPPPAKLLPPKLSHFNALPPARFGPALKPAVQPARDKLFNFEAPEEELPSLVSQLFSEYDVKTVTSAPAVPVTTAAPQMLGVLQHKNKSGRKGKNSGQNIYIQKIEIGPGNFEGDNFGSDFMNAANALRRLKGGHATGGKNVNIVPGKVVKAKIGRDAPDDESSEDPLAGFGDEGIDSLFGFGKGTFDGINDAVKPEPKPEPETKPEPVPEPEKHLLF